MAVRLSERDKSDLIIKEDIDSFMIVAEKLSAFTPAKMTISYSKKVRRCENKKLTSVLGRLTELKYWLEFRLGGREEQGIHVLVGKKDGGIPIGTKEHFLEMVISTAFSKLPIYSHSRILGETIGQGSRHRLTVYNRDGFDFAQLVDRELKNLVDSAQPPYLGLRFYFYRCCHGIRSTPRDLVQLFENIISDRTAIVLTQLHLGIDCYLPKKPLFLDVKSLRREFVRSRKFDIKMYHPYNFLSEGYLTCRHPFGEDDSMRVSFIQYYNPAQHHIRFLKNVNTFTYELFGRFSRSHSYIRGKFRHAIGHSEKIRAFINGLRECLKVRGEIVINFKDIEEALAYCLGESTDAYDKLRNITKPNLRTLNSLEIWHEHVSRTGNRYLVDFSNHIQSFQINYDVLHLSKAYDEYQKLRFWIEGSTKYIDYNRLIYLTTGKCLKCTVYENAILTYYDENNNYIDIVPLNLRKMKITRGPIPFPWFAECLEICMWGLQRYTAAPPHRIFLKCVAKLAYTRSIDREIGWTRTETHDFSLRRLSRAKRNSKEHHWLGQFRIVGTVTTKSIILCLTRPTSEQIGLFLSASESIKRFSLPSLEREIYANVQVFPMLFLTGRNEDRHTWTYVTNDGTEPKVTLANFEKLNFLTRQQQRQQLSRPSMMMNPVVELVRLENMPLFQALSEHKQAEKEEAPKETRTRSKYNEEQDKAIVRFAVSAMQNGYNVGNPRTWTDSENWEVCLRGCKPLGMRRRLLTLRSKGLLRGYINEPLNNQLLFNQLLNCT